MPTTVASLMVILFAVLPGVPGDRLYCLFMGHDWRESQTQRVLRLLAFSLAGLATYAVVALRLGLPAPVYVTPWTLEATASAPNGMFAILLPLAGHFVCSALVGMIVAVGLSLITKITPLSLYSNAWDHFVFSTVKYRWVILGLTNGESYFGRIEIADTSVSAGERDLVLEEPAKYDENSGTYESMTYQYIFLPGEMIASIGVVHDPEMDSRIIPVGTDPFPKENSSGKS